MKRRDFLKLSALGATASTLPACGADPVESMIPMLVPPPHFSPGKSIYYATSCKECTAACGLIVKTREGRAIKIEGNPSHPSNKGKICAIGQAALQGLYSPARFQSPLLKKDQTEKSISWLTGIELLTEKIKENQADPTKRILFLGPPESGTLGKLIRSSLSAWGGGDYLSIDLTPVHSYRTANRITFGEHSIPHLDISQAETLINFGSDFLESWLSPVRFTREYTQFHAYRQSKKGRFIHISAHMSLTASNADQWISCESGTEHIIAFLLASCLVETSSISGKEKEKIKHLLLPLVKKYSVGKHKTRFDFIEELAGEFKSKRCICLAGGNSSARRNATQLHVAVNLINYLSGEINKSVQFGADYQLGGNSMQAIKTAISQLQDGAYSLVIIHNVNPLFALPQLDFEDALKQAPFIVSLSTEQDETSGLAQLTLPTNHYLQSWGDSQPAKAIYNFQQPVMAALPGYDTREIGDLLLHISQLINPSAFQFKNFRDYLIQSWQGLFKDKKITPGFPDFWRSCIQHGGYYQDFQRKTVSLKSDFFSYKIEDQIPPVDGLTLLGVNSNLQNSNGHTGNKYWLLEVPNPLSQVAWDSWVDIHPDTARKHGISTGDRLEISSPYGSLNASARLFYGIDLNTIAMPTGLGRSLLFPDYPSRKGRFPLLDILESKKPIEPSRQKIGENVMALFPDTYEEQSGDFLFAISGIRIRSLGQTPALPIMDGQHDAQLKKQAGFFDLKHTNQTQKARGLVQTININKSGRLAESDQSINQTASAKKAVDRRQGFYEAIDKNVAVHLLSTTKSPPEFYKPIKWEMVIDLDRCTGCSACVVACYAENNIAIVGKNRVQQGREMSWIRVERYFELNPLTGKTETYLFPQMCAQCDNAGCEPVCPVSATYKTSDGLNAMIYNRCIGSRYCSNNCIYSQRRFNWRSYEFLPPLHYQLNPDVTVREKGVMEKCTFCQQRIREKGLIAKKENRELGESEVQTACQQTCPANAITFGNVKNSSDKVSKLKADSLRRYTQFESLNYQPAISYLKKVIQNNQKA